MLKTVKFKGFQAFIYISGQALSSLKIFFVKTQPCVIHTHTYTRHCKVLLYGKVTVPECSSHSTFVKVFPSFFIRHIITARFLHGILPGEFNAGATGPFPFGLFPLIVLRTAMTTLTA